MEKIETKLDGVYILEPKVFGDHRGYFMETYSEKVFRELEIDNVFVQDNESLPHRRAPFAGCIFRIILCRRQRLSVFCRVR